MSNLFQSLVYNKETNQLGLVVEASFLKNTYTVQVDDDEFITVNMEDALVLQELGTVGADTVYENDVLVSRTTDYEYEIVTQEDGTLILHLLDGKYNRVKHGASFPKSEIGKLAEDLELLGSIHLLKEDLPTVDFNIVVVRRVVNGEVSYAYACNNRLEEEVDLISVVFVGHQLLEEEDYTRVSLPYEGYLESVERGLIKEVNPQELANYVTGLMYGRNPQVSTEGLIIVGKDLEMSKEGMKVSVHKEEGEEDASAENIENCKCGSHPSDCDCNLWKY